MEVSCFKPVSMNVTLYRIVSFVVVFLLASVFVYTGVTKLLGGIVFAGAIAAYRILPVWSVNAVAIVLPMLEVAVGVAVLFSRTRRAALWMMGLLLGVFMVALAQAIVRGLEIDCGCFGGGEVGKSSLYWLWRGILC
jgi:hypothetical protein